MKRKASPEQIQRKKEMMKNLLLMLKSLDENQRQAIAEKLPLMNPEGHSFSPNNVCLIAYQNEGNIPLTILAGFKQWIDKGRVVRKGEHGFTIFYPSQAKGKKDNDNNANGGDISEENFNLRFYTATVFDISQTEELNAGEDGPECSSNNLSLIINQS